MHVRIFLCCSNSIYIPLLIESDVFKIKSKALSVSVPPVDGLSPRPRQLPLAIPNDIADRYVLSF